MSILEIEKVYESTNGFGAYFKEGKPKFVPYLTTNKEEMKLLVVIKKFIKEHPEKFILINRNQR